MKAFFWGNYFYGICAVALVIETNSRFYYTLDAYSFLFLIFFIPVFYYNKSFLIGNRKTRLEADERSIYLKDNIQKTNEIKQFLNILAILSGILLLKNNYLNLLNIQISTILLLIFFLLIAIFYYGIKDKNLRQIGWLKPFIIGFVWSAFVSILPAIYYTISQDFYFIITPKIVLLFIENFIFISILSIIFDFKDYKNDAYYTLNTYIVFLGLKRTIYYILLPLTFIYTGFILFESGLHYAIIWRLLPIIALLFLINKLITKRQNIWFYYIFIDGLMLLKAVCGILYLQ